MKTNKLQILIFVSAILSFSIAAQENGSTETFLGIGSGELWKAFLVPISMIIMLAILANTLLNRGVSIKTE